MTLPTPKSGILSIAPYVPGKASTGLSERPPIKLSSNETPYGPSPMAIDAYRRAGAHLHRYPDGNASVLREAIGQAYGLDPARIICGAGSDELIQYLVHAYAGPGDEVLYPAHGFLMYKIYALGFGATPVTAPEKDLHTDVDALLAAVTPRTKIVFVANPNNPTGTYIPASEMQRLRDGLPEHVILAVDGAYTEFVEDAPGYADGIAMVDSGQNTVVLRTFSKIHGLAALRIGWGYFPEGIADVINRVRGPFNLSSPAQAAGVAAIRDTEFATRTRELNRQCRAWLMKELGKLGLGVIPSETNFVLVRFPDDPAKNAAAANVFLQQNAIIVRDVAAYGLGAYLRITVGTDEENHLVVEALSRFLSA